MAKGNKILQYFDANKIPYKYVGFHTQEHYGGKSFYNDGIYWIDEYIVTISDKQYKLIIKTSGRPMFWLFDGKELITAAFSQKQLIEIIERRKIIELKKT